MHVTVTASISGRDKMKVIFSSIELSVHTAQNWTETEFTFSTQQHRWHSANNEGIS